MAHETNIDQGWEYGSDPSDPLGSSSTRQIYKWMREAATEASAVAPVEASAMLISDTEALS